MRPKLTPYQERLCKLRCEQALSEAEIAKILGIKHQTVRLHFLQIRQNLKMKVFEDVWRDYKNPHPQPGQRLLERLEEKIKDSHEVDIRLRVDSYNRVVRDGGKSFEEWVISRIED